jgi:hypothetical protein
MSESDAPDEETVRDGEAGATDRGRRVIQALLEHGRSLGFDAVAEFPVPGGRIDVVWLWRLPGVIPGAPNALPVVGFEVESSWRTRKHIKGDLINLQDLATSLGIIVLLGDGEKVESTRRFASQLVDRPGSRIVVWSERDVDELVAFEAPVAESAIGFLAVPPVARTPAAGPRGAVEHAGKYRPLWFWLREQVGPAVSVSFAEVETILGFALPPSSRRHLPHWYGYDNTAVGRAIQDAGWRARRVSLEHETVTFERDLEQSDG